MLIGIPERYADIVNTTDSPRVIEWYARMMARPGVKASLAIPRPLYEREAATRSQQ
jgi:glutathione S-transferase